MLLLLSVAYYVAYYQYINNDNISVESGSEINIIDKKFKII